LDMVGNMFVWSPPVKQLTAIDITLVLLFFLCPPYMLFGKVIKLNIEALLIADPDPEKPAIVPEQDSYIKLEVVYFF
ncbi:MAG: hypothetical protein D3924_11370, partial [Candidatus Electrothrix sp. AR4]|nr:hypothetical protein [Candidatus Electrothrix sp. AR4]